jgi:hypothetical protein
MRARAGGLATVRRLLKISGVLVLTALALSVAAAEAAAPSLKPGKAYSTGTGKHAVSITLATSVRTPNRIEEGEAAAGSQYALSEGSVQCPRAKRNPGFKGAPFALFGMPGTTLRLQGGAYSFSAKVRAPNTTPLGAAVKPFTLKVKVTGTVVSATKISGTISAGGGPCRTKKPVPYIAMLDPKLPVAPQ